MYTLRLTKIYIYLPHTDPPSQPILPTRLDPKASHISNGPGRVNQLQRLSNYTSDLPATSRLRRYSDERLTYLALLISSSQRIRRHTDIGHSRPKKHRTTPAAHHVRFLDGKESGCWQTTEEDAKEARFNIYIQWRHIIARLL
jgi:hypothetical protein